MLKRLFIVSLFLLPLNGCSDKYITYESDENELKAEALDFAMQVVNCIIECDSTRYKTFLPDIIYGMEPWDELIPLSDFDVSGLLAAYDYSEYSLTDYKDVYSYQIMNYKEYSVVDTEWIEAFENWIPDDQDYLFRGNRVKEGKQAFMFEDILIFMVSKRSGEWKIRAL